MAHFAKVEDGIVVDVIVAEQDFIDTLDGTWIQTSYNTRGNVHYAPNTNTPDGGVPLRYNYAGIGYTYDAVKDAFIEPQPFASWTLDDETCMWIAPIPMPEDGLKYIWNEQDLVWEQISEFE